MHSVTHIPFHFIAQLLLLSASVVRAAEPAATQAEQQPKETAGFTVVQPGENKITLQASDAEALHVIFLKAPAGKKPITGLKLDLVSLTREDGRATGDATLTCAVCDESLKTPKTLKPEEPLRLTLQGKKLEKAKYLSMLRLDYAEQQTQLIPLELNFTAEAAALEVSELQTIAAQPPTLLQRLGLLTPAPAKARFNVCDTAGQPARIYWPLFSPLSLVEKENSQFNVGGAQCEVESLTINGQKQNDLQQDPGEIPPRGCAAFVYSIKGLEKTGHYQGQVSVYGPARAKTTKTFNVLVRDSALSAWLVIALGVAGSYLLFNWTRQERARDLRSARIAQLRTEWLRYFPLNTADAVRDEMLARLDRLQEQNRNPDSLAEDALKASLTDLLARLRLYRQAPSARARVTELLARYPTTTPEEERKKAEFERDLRDRWKEIEDALLKLEGQGLGNEEADATARLKALHTLFDQIRQSLVTLPANALLAELDALAQEDKTRVAEIGELKAELTQIVKLAGEGNFTGLTDRLDTARAQYAGWRLEQLQQLIEQTRREIAISPYASQPGQDKPVLDQLAAATSALGEAQAETGAAGKLAKWEQARQHYLRALIEHLKLLGSDKGRPAGMSAAAWAAELKQAPNLQNTLNQAEQALDLDNFGAAEGFYRQARAEYLRLITAWLKHQIKELKELMSREHLFLFEEADWQKAKEAGPLKDLLDALDALPEKLPSVGDADYRNKLHAARGAFATWQLSALRLGLEWLETRDAKVRQDDPNHSNYPLWHTRLTPKLAELRARLDEQENALKHYDAASDKDAAFPTMLEAEKHGFAAQQLYLEMLDLAPKALSGAKLSATAAATGATGTAPTLLTPLAEAGSSAGLGGNLLPEAPDADLRNLSRIVPPEQQPASYWYDRVNRGDRLALGIVLVAASFTGLVAVWANNATFGSLMDYLNAFLWGFGFDAASKGFSAIANTTKILPGDTQ